MISQLQVYDSPPGEADKQLSGNEVHLYFSWPEQISDPALLRRYDSLLSADERARMSRFHSARNRHQYLVTRALVRSTLSAYCPVDPEAWRFGKNRYGKPEISHPPCSPPLRFNISHTHGLSVCAITRDYAIGVDVEDLERSTQSGLSNLGSYFSTREADDLRALPTLQQRQRFFDYWTLKESYIKARGAGLAIPLGKFSFLFKADKLQEFIVDPELQDDADCWQFWRIGVADRYRVAVAMRSKRRGIKVTVLKSVPLQNTTPVTVGFL